MRAFQIFSLLFASILMTAEGRYVTRASRNHVRHIRHKLER